MADGAPTGNQAILTSRWGPAPVWVWLLGGLVLAWIWAKYRDLKSAAAGNTDQTPAAGSTGDGAAEGQAVAPQFIIENNMPETYQPVPTPTPGPSTAPSQPVTTPTGPTPVINGPGSAPKPPTVTPVGQYKPPAQKKSPLPYKVHTGDTLSSIAAKHTNPKTGKPFTWQELWTFNTTPGNRSADVIALLKKRGPNLIYPNETILIPQ